MSRVVGVLLAAGAGRRFGKDKLLARMPDGEPVGLKAARALIGAGIATVVVTRPGDLRLAEMMRGAGASVAESPAPEQGMGLSIATGVATALDADAWVIALADMPWIRPITIRRVVDALAAGAQICAPSFNGRRGHPVGFARGYRDRLLALNGDAGAHRLIAAASDPVVLLPTDDSGILLDVDEPEDIYVELDPISGPPQH
ncbi:nucleotidyltransferase family protein [Thiorhodococcus mannitoliphagus]|uniref:Nucleotidyltransferase family protein n=1 Tax=Thiorhodococcus mannitoliphagus TaxID=329406 RepID=A0A6P1DS17_9GAMM|nr:nucleotidyltransferase family protein [Thiorhodococcus mannitoliphagus]NEX20848.1 nucleotidyltransferase family protein [Thiorhodococcus mannitoliphagus]